MLQMHKSRNLVFMGKAIFDAKFMLKNTSSYVIGDTNVKNAVGFICKDVYVVVSE